MGEANRFLAGLSGLQKASLTLGVLVIVAAVVLVAWWAMRAPKSVLFSELSNQDVALLVAELDKLKVPFSVSSEGDAVLVDEAAVHKTRMALMTKPLPFQGAVGFELFNNADFGVSDYVQKINYQRALQGELTRTILSIDKIKSARVHLALPEQTLFKRDANKAKASIALTLKPGTALAPAQVLGIQRLVSASVQDIKTEDVTVIDQGGVVLSRAAGDELSAAVGQLDAKSAIEQMLTRKATQLLDLMFSPGEHMVAVDVALSNQQRKLTTEEVLAAGKPDKDLQPAGVIVREKTVSRDSPGSADGTTGAGTVVTNQEVEYQTGKRIEQVVSAAGAITRVNVGVVLKHPFDAQQVERVKSVIGAAVGLDESRGDAISVYTMPLAAAIPIAADAIQDGPGPNGMGFKTGQSLKPGQASALTAPPGDRRNDEAQSARTVQVLSVVLAIAAFAALAWAVLRLRQQAAQNRNALSSTQREALLQRMQDWVHPPKGTTL
jgi:flagellar M-ring protein FliF